MIPAAVAAAASVPMLFEGLLHMPSLPVLVMLFVGCADAGLWQLANQFVASGLRSRIPGSLHLLLAVTVPKMASMGDYSCYGGIQHGTLQ